MGPGDANACAAQSLPALSPSVTVRIRPRMPLHIVVGVSPGPVVVRHASVSRLRSSRLPVPLRPYRLPLVRHPVEVVHPARHAMHHALPWHPHPLAASATARPGGVAPAGVVRRPTAWTLSHPPSSRPPPHRRASPGSRYPAARCPACSRPGPSTGRPVPSSSCLPTCRRAG